MIMMKTMIIFLILNVVKVIDKIKNLNLYKYYIYRRRQKIFQKIRLKLSERNGTNKRCQNQKSLMNKPLIFKIFK